jgi:hypothetical protein
MKDDLLEEGYDINVLAINSVGKESSIANLVDTCSYPVFQDTELEDVWGQHQATKDDMFIYDVDHNLASFFDCCALSILTTEEHYDGVKAAIIAAH